MTTTLLGRHVVLVGPMGSGKTTIGRQVAHAIGRPFLDSDEEVLRRTGETSEAIAARSGRDELHGIERRVLLDALEGDALVVVAAAAGVVDDPVCVTALRARAEVIGLTAPRATLLARIGNGRGRPIAEPIAPALEELEGPRNARYAAVVDRTVGSGDEDPDPVATIVASLRHRVRVALGDRGYDVVIGPGVRREVGSALPATAQRAAVVTQPGIGVEIELGLPSETFELPPGEGAKSLATVETLTRAFSRFGLTRADVVIAVGGGVVTDCAGFAAAVYHRGTALVNVSTTLLGQVDAAIGGKTGVNIPEGKNLVGAFWQPTAVFCDTDVLETLSDRERRSGLGEMAKYAFLGLEDLPARPIVDQVAACAAAKAAVVGADEREGGLRMTLNYGHTLAHALEAAGFADGPGRDGVDLRHGEAVAIGLVFAAELARSLGRIDDARVARHREVVASYGLPGAIPPTVDLDEAIAAMGRDKKATDGLVFMLDGPHGVEAVRGIPHAAVRSALERTVEGAMVEP